MSTVAVIAAYNEQQRIATTINAIAKINDIDSILVVDDGSKDETAREASAAGARVERLRRNMGKGAALTCAITSLIDSEKSLPDFILLLDADLGTSATQAAPLLWPLQNDISDLVIGVLPKIAGSGGFGMVRSLASDAIAQTAKLSGNHIYTLPANDSNNTSFRPLAPLSGQRAIRAALLPVLLPFAKGFGVEVSMTMRALAAGMRVSEIPVELYHRTTGRNLRGFMHRGRQYLDVALAIRKA
ncbi:MAG: glycosyltransferase family 2 protein [Coriobacteriales bacterium]|jgi:glycosyltransferase involved in cell wall biosynthesis|nr:glycosyltransferase family 2 protein [Coriobacteriales bacterium]